MFDDHGETPDVVEQARGDNLRPVPRLLGEGRALERMLEFGDVLPVRTMSPCTEDLEDRRDDFCPLHNRILVPLRHWVMAIQKRN